MTPRFRPSPYRALTIVYAASGFTLSSWWARLPAIRDAAGLDPDGLARRLLVMSVGTVLTLLLSGVLVQRLGAGRAARQGNLLAGLGLAGLGLAPHGANLLLALPAIGIGNSLCDVAMNVEGTHLERGGERVMPRLHGWFSVGTACGAAFGAGAAALGIPLGLDLGVAGAGVAAATALATKWLPLHPPDVEPWPTESGASPWLLTTALGMVIFGFAFAEGTANEWLTLALKQGYGLTHQGAAIGLGGFLLAMTLVRLKGTWLSDRLQEATLVGGSVLAVMLGTALVLLGAHEAVSSSFGPVAGAVGIILWGMGTALGFPITMRAAGSSRQFAHTRISVASAIGYTSFLVGPPLLGPIAHDHGYLGTVAVAPVVMAAAVGMGSLLRTLWRGRDRRRIGPRPPGPSSPREPPQDPGSAEPESGPEEPPPVSGQPGLPPRQQRPQLPGHGAALPSDHRSCDP